jgi:hypothetical protein
MAVAAAIMNNMKAPAHLRRLDKRLVQTDARLREWAKWQVQGGAGVNLGYPRQWATGGIPGSNSGPTPTPKEPVHVAEVGAALCKLDAQERKIVECEYCNAWQDRDERYRLTDLKSREYREALMRARWQVKALLSL